MQVHQWLEKTAFFKMPRSQEQELVAEMKQPFENVRTILSHECTLWMVFLVGQHLSLPETNRDHSSAHPMHFEK